MKNIFYVIFGIALLIAYHNFFGAGKNTNTETKPAQTQTGVNLEALAPLREADKNTKTSSLANTQKIKTTNNNLPVTNPVGNTFEKAKKKMEKIYTNEANTMPRVDIYCGCKYSVTKRVDGSCGFEPKMKGARGTTIEWEHIIPAENFGQSFKEWREGNTAVCGDKKGRECAKKNSEFARMEGDMYNLYPAIGEVNALRSNFRYVELNKNDAGVEEIPNCNNILINKKERTFTPAKGTRGELARVYLYFDAVYNEYNLSKAQKELFTAWSNAEPISAMECKRYFLIREEQKSDNPILAYECKKMLDEANKAAGK